MREADEMPWRVWLDFAVLKVVGAWLMSGREKGMRRRHKLGLASVCGRRGHGGLSPCSALNFAVDSKPCAQVGVGRLRNLRVGKKPAASRPPAGPGYRRRPALG